MAKKEHRELINVMDMLEELPPGLYEMVIEQQPMHGVPQNLNRIRHRAPRDPDRGRHPRVEPRPPPRGVVVQHYQAGFRDQWRALRTAVRSGGAPCQRATRTVPMLTHCGPGST